MKPGASSASVTPLVKWGLRWSLPPTIMTSPVRWVTLLPLPLLSFWFIFSSYYANPRLDQLRQEVLLPLESGWESEVAENRQHCVPGAGLRTSQARPNPQRHKVLTVTLPHQQGHSGLVKLSHCPGSQTVERGRGRP